jgi:DNA processing protein
MTAYSAPILSENERLHLLRLARSEHVGPISFAHLLQRYGNAQEALDRLPSIARRGGANIPSMDVIKREREAHEKQGIHLLCAQDPAYPEGLRHLKDAPPFISVLGRLDLFQKTLFSIVGARHASQAGERIATQISEQLSAKSWVLVSGLARGIDACVHNASLHEGGTLAVIAGGIGHIYPPEHKKLYAEIAEKGAIISEDPLFISPHAGLFPKRNRIISGLSWGSLIVEASLRSGSLLTAKYAADQGRTVLAIPGHPLDFRARGANKLLKQGACLVETTDDILCEYTSSHRYLAKEDSPDGYEAMPALLPESSTLAKDIYGLLGVVPTSVSELSEKLGISPVSIRIALIEMELNGEIERYPGDAVIACM